MAYFFPNKKITYKNYNQTKKEKKSAKQLTAYMKLP